METIVTQPICEVVIVDLERQAVVSCSNDATAFDSQALEFRCQNHPAPQSKETLLLTGDRCLSCNNYICQCEE